MKNYKQLSMVITFAVITIFSASCSKENFVDTMNPANSIKTIDLTENGTNPDDAILSSESAKMSSHGYLYTESNDATLNTILMYKMNEDGTLMLESTTNSGGAGAGVGLGSQGALAMSENHQWLFAVNAGDNSISSFQVNEDGSLTLVHTVSSSGEMPVSVDVWGNYLYVVNFLSSDINGYMIGDDGMLTEIADTNHGLSTTNAQPAQIKFHPSGKVVYVTEKHTNRITDFLIDDMGVANSMDWRHSNAHTPFGFDFARDEYMVVSNAEGGLPNESSVSSYRTTETGLVNDFDNEAVGTEQTAACWVAITNHGRYAYVTNTGSNSVSSYFIDGSGMLYLIDSVAATTGLAPLDITLLGNYYVYTLNGTAHTIGEYTRASGGQLTYLGEVEDVPTYAAGLVGF